MKRCVIVFAHCVTWSGGGLLLLISFPNDSITAAGGIIRIYGSREWDDYVFLSCKQRVKGNIKNPVHGDLIQFIEPTSSHFQS
jgi:hypothetical protein